MSGNPPHLPILPAGFGTDSSYPPIPGSTRITASQPKPSRPPAMSPAPILTGSHRPVAPPLPPLPLGALQKEQQHRWRRHQSASYSSSPSFRPGYLVHAPPTPTPPPPPQPPSSHPHFVGGFTSPPPQHAQHRTGTPVAAAAAAARPPQAMPTPNYGRVSAHAPPQPPPSSTSHSQSLASNMQNPSVQNDAYPSSARRASANDAYAAGPSSLSRPPQPPAAGAASSSNSDRPPSLSAPLPDMGSLAALRDRARDDKQRINWAKQMLKFVERNYSDGSKISEPYLVRWTDEAISIITRNASSQNPEPEALYLRGDLQASGAFPAYIAKSLQKAFNDFELSARMGWAPSWFRIGRDYEVLGDLSRAVHAYDRGVQAGNVGSIYRMGMANLLGQLDLPVNHARAIAMLRGAADKADLDTPQPSYIYGMLLAREFSHVDIPPHLLKPSNVQDSTEDEARRRIQRAAYLNFAPAQYKCGWLYEYAQLGCAFDPLLSVQYYSLASQGGEIEADMALSKWFLCGAEQYFEKNETLAYTFADKAARKGLPSAEFALAYYHEVGVGTERNVDFARKWYRKAAAKDNADAKERLQALQGPQAHGMSRQQHEAVMDHKLVRQRTQAKMLSDRAGRSPMHEHDQYFGVGDGGGGRRPSGAVPASSAAAASAGPSNTNGRLGGGGGGNLELSRKKTMKMVEETAAGRQRPNYGGFDSRPAQQQQQPPPPPMPPITQYQPPQVRPIGATPQPIPILQPSSTPDPAGRITSGTHHSQTPGGHGAGYTLQDSNPPPSASNSTSSYPTPHHTAASSYANASSNPSTTASSNGGSDDSAAAAAAGVGGGKKPYNTFAEMGFAPQKQKKEECVIA
ncbi:related to SKT5 - protoplast regeneration and killer toxin resistance protein [Ustilago sp. UG-2017b]|nr:related to SKT5 - protoplast regeneration and killer toxin resistance protein [Ustilago sp. UG-2017b]